MTGSEAPVFKQPITMACSPPDPRSLCLLWATGPSCTTALVKMRVIITASEFPHVNIMLYVPNMFGIVTFLRKEYSTDIVLGDDREH